MRHLTLLIGLWVLSGWTAAAHGRTFKDIGTHNNAQLLRAVWKRPAARVTISPRTEVIKTQYSGCVITRNKNGAIEKLDQFSVGQHPYARPGRRLSMGHGKHILVARAKENAWIARIDYPGSDGSGKPVREFVSVESNKAGLTAQFPGRPGRRAGTGTYDPKTGRAQLSVRSNWQRGQPRAPDFNLKPGLPVSEVVRALEDKLSLEGGRRFGF